MRVLPKLIIGFQLLRGEFRKKTDNLKTSCKLVLTPPYLILDIFILDKYKLVFTPPPPT